MLSEPLIQIRTLTIGVVSQCVKVTNDGTVPFSTCKCHVKSPWSVSRTSKEAEVAIGIAAYKRDDDRNFFAPLERIYCVNSECSRVLSMFIE